MRIEELRGVKEIGEERINLMTVGWIGANKFCGGKCALNPGCSSKNGSSLKEVIRQKSLMMGESSS